MSVKQRGLSWQASITYKGKRHRKDFPNEREAPIWEAQMKADLLSGRLEVPTGPPVPTLQEHFEHVCATRWRGKKAEKNLKMCARQVVEILGPNRLVSTLNKADADTIKLAFIKRQRSDGTINRKLAALSVLANEAIEREFLVKGFKLGLIKERQGRVRFFTEEEEQAMLTFLQGHRAR